MGMEGVEPPTPRASVVCSPAELHSHRFLAYFQITLGKSIIYLKISCFLNVVKVNNSLGYLRY